MKLLLYCDEYCYKYNGDYYLEDFGIVLLNRYLSTFESIKYPVRVKEIQTKEDLGHFNNKINSDFIQVVEIPYGHGLKDYIKNFRIIVLSLWGICKECDLAILRMPSIYSFTIWHYVKKASLPYAVEIVFDCYDGYLSSTTWIDKIAWKLMHNWQQKACEEAMGVSCVTEQYLQKRYYPLSSKAITSHYSSIELPESFFYKNRKYPQRKPLKIVHIAYQVCYNSRKGHNQLIQALQIVINKGIDIEVYFVGGNYENGIEKLTNFAESLGVKKHVHFLGFMKRENLKKLMMEVDLAVLPTKAEGLPRVIIEAMATGLPCISTNVSGNPELLDPKYLIDYSDVEGLSRVIMSLLNNPEEYERASLSNYKRSRKYESNILQKRRIDFYTKLRNKILQSK